jgi:hypothetical protein
MLGVGGSSIKVTSTVASRSGYTILVGARYRWPTESAWSPSFGLGVEFINPFPLTDLIDWHGVAHLALRVGVEFDASTYHGGSQ